MRRKVADLFERFYPHYAGEDQLFKSKVEACLTGVEVILDAGCGSGRMAGHDFRQGRRTIVGIDADDDVRKNASLTYAIRGNLAALPLMDGSVDLILCRYVLEHIEEPATIFREFCRVLREKGKIVLLTPNLWHYVTLVSRVAPWWFHRWFNAVYGVSETDTFKTFYRANTRRRITCLAAQAGLRVGRMELMETSPNYLEFSRLLYRLGIAYERVVNNISVCAEARVNIVATLVK